MAARFRLMNCTRMWRVHTLNIGHSLLFLASLATALATAEPERDERIEQVRATQAARSIPSRQ